MKRWKLFLILILIFSLVAYVIVLKPQTSNYSDNHPVLDKVREAFMELNPKYGEIPLREGNSAYTENKKTITLCLKIPGTNRYYDMNTIMYVALHELAHVLCKSQGHNAEFKEKFSIILREASRRKIYNPTKEIPQTYCGVGPDD